MDSLQEDILMLVLLPIVDERPLHMDDYGDFIEFPPPYEEEVYDWRN